MRAVILCWQGCMSESKDVWAILTDVREEQPDERLQTDGLMDYNFLSFLGADDHLYVVSRPGTHPDVKEQWGERLVSMIFSRSQAGQVGHALVNWSDTGEWSCNFDPEIPDSVLPHLGEGDFRI